MCYCPHFSDEETLVKKSHNSLHRGRGYLPGHLDQNQVFRLLAGLFLLCLSYGVGMTNFYSCPHRTKIEKLKQDKEGLIHRQGGTASARTRGKLWILSPRGDFKERADQLPVADGTAHPPTSRGFVHFHRLPGFSYGNFVHISIVAFTDEEAGMKGSSVLSMITQLVRGKAKIRICGISHK